MTCRGLLTPTLWWVHLQLLYSRRHCEEWMKRLLRKTLHIQVDHRWYLGFNSSCGNNKQNLPFTTFPCQTSDWMLLFITNWSLVLNTLHTIIATMAVFSPWLLWWLWNSSSIYFFFPFLFSLVFTCHFSSCLPRWVCLCQCLRFSLFLFKWIIVQLKSRVIMSQRWLYLGVTVCLCLQFTHTLTYCIHTHIQLTLQPICRSYRIGWAERSLDCFVFILNVLFMWESDHVYMLHAFLAFPNSYK